MWRFGQVERPAPSKSQDPKEKKVMENDSMQLALLEHCGEPPRFDLSKHLNEWTRQSCRNPPAESHNTLNTVDLDDNLVFTDQPWKQPGFISKYYIRQIDLQLQSQLQLQRKIEKVKKAAAEARPKARPAKPTVSYEESDMGLFGRLPGELRNNIYRLVCVAETQPMVVESYERECCRGKCAHNSITAITSGLANTCRSIRHEMMPIFVEENDFKFESAAVRNRCVGNWIKALGPYAILLKKVQLEFSIGTRFTDLSMDDVGSVTIKKEAGLVPKSTEEIKEAVAKARMSKNRSFRFDGHDLIIKFSPNIPQQCVKKCDLKWAVLKILHSEADHETKVVEFVDSDGLADLLFWCQK